MKPAAPYLERIRHLEKIAQLSLRQQDELLARAATTFEFGPGDMVYLEGMRDGFVNYLLRGRVERIVNGRTVNVIEADRQRHDTALDGGPLKHETIRAISSVTVLRVQRDELERLYRQSPGLDVDDDVEVMDIASDTSTDWWTRLLRSDVFSRLSASSIHTIFDRMQEVSVTTGEYVLHQGDDGDAYYVIESGQCQVLRHPPAGGHEVCLAELGPGDGFGEEALIANTTRNASVRMATDGKLMRLGKTDFLELVVDPQVRGVSFRQGGWLVEQGATWVDVREPAANGAGTPPGALRVPLHLLRVQAKRLHDGAGYVVFSENVDEAMLAAFLLAARGLEAAYLEEPVSRVGTTTPPMAPRSDVTPIATAPIATAPGTNVTPIDAASDTDAPPGAVTPDAGEAPTEVSANTDVTSIAAAPGIGEAPAEAAPEIGVTPAALTPGTGVTPPEAAADASVTLAGATTETNAAAGAPGTSVAPAEVTPDVNAAPAAAAADTSETPAGITADMNASPGELAAGTNVALIGAPAGIDIQPDDEADADVPSTSRATPGVEESEMNADNGANGGQPPGTPAAADGDVGERLDRDEFAHTTTGEELAELIDEIYRERQAFQEGDAPPIDDPAPSDPHDAPTLHALPDTLGAVPATAPEVLGIASDDILGDIMHEVESGLSSLVRQCIEQQRTAIAARVKERLERIERAAQAHIAAHERELTARYEAKHAESEKRLGETYDRLTSLANRISHQKADIQKARKALEEMLRTANRVHQEVHRVGNALVDQIDHLDVLNDDLNVH